MIKKGTACIWQNCTDSKAYLNESECVALSDLHFQMVYIGNRQEAITLCYLTDTHYVTPNVKKVQIAARPWELREKNSPQDETNLIEEKELEHG
jgi:hypothetical protein